MICFSLGVMACLIAGCRTPQADSFGIPERYRLHKKNLEQITLLDAAYLKSCGVKVRKVDTRSGYIEAKGPASVANINYAHQRQCVSPYISENFTLLHTNIPSASVTSFWSGRE